MRIIEFYYRPYYRASPYRDEMEKQRQFDQAQEDHLIEMIVGEDG